MCVCVFDHGRVSYTCVSRAFVIAVVAAAAAARLRSRVWWQTRCSGDGSSFFYLVNSTEISRLARASLFEDHLDSLFTVQESREPRHKPGAVLFYDLKIEFALN